MKTTQDLAPRQQSLSYSPRTRIKRPRVNGNPCPLEVREALAQDEDRRSEKAAAEAQPDAAGTAGRITHRTQDREGGDGDPGDADPDPPPSTRQVFDYACTLIESGQFGYFVTIRLPSPTSKKWPSYRPEVIEERVREIARSLADLGIYGAYFVAFRSVSTKHRTTPHIHALLSKPIPYHWAKAYKTEFGRRAVHCTEIDTRQRSPKTISWYIARQTVSIAIGGPRTRSRPFVRSVVVLDDVNELVSLAEEGEKKAKPVEVASYPRRIPPEARRRLEELGLLRPRPPP